MNSKVRLIVAGVLTSLSGILLLAALLRSGRNAATRVPEEKNIDVNVVRPVAEEAPVDGAAIVRKNLFSRTRGAAPEQTNAAPLPPVLPPEVAAAPAAPPPNLEMLGEYPNDWPRLKLTGVYRIRGVYAAVITGGDEKTVLTGDRYYRLYRPGDEIGGGVFLVRADARSALLRKDNKGWTIALGADPPAVKKQ